MRNPFFILCDKLQIAKVPHELLVPVGAAWNDLVASVVNAINRVVPYGYDGVWRVQNLKEDKRGGWWHFRGWVHRAYRDDAHRATFSWEACARPRLQAAWSIARGDERDIHGHVSLFGIAFYWGVEGVGLAGEERELSVRFHDGRLFWTIWKDPNSWSSRDGWRNDSWNIDELVRGPVTYASEILERREVQIPTPEGTYPAIVELSRDTWSRPRWPTEVVMRAHINVPKGIPMAGKGENAWDLDDDATFGMTGPASSVEDGIGRLVASVLLDRWKRSGTHGWDRATKPEAAA